MLTKYQVTLYARNLPTGFLRLPSAYAVVTIDGGSQAGTSLGRTEIIPGQASPQWTTCLFLETDASQYMPLKVSIYNDSDSSSPLAEALFEATEVFRAPGHSQETYIDNTGKSSTDVTKHNSHKTTVGIRIHKSQQGTDAGFVTLQLRGLDIKNIEAGILGLGRSDPFFEIHKKNLDPNHGTVHWTPVYRSKYINNHLNPYWKEFTIDLETLCYQNMAHPLQIKVLDWNANGKYREIGKFECVLPQLRDNVARRGNADRLRAFPLTASLDARAAVGSEDISFGMICILKCDVRLTNSPTSN